jgi:hypothetical protein
LVEAKFSTLIVAKSPADISLAGLFAMNTKFDQWLFLMEFSILDILTYIRSCAHLLTSYYFVKGVCQVVVVMSEFYP